MVPLIPPVAFDLIRLSGLDGLYGLASLCASNVGEISLSHSARIRSTESNFLLLTDSSAPSFGSLGYSQSPTWEQVALSIAPRADDSMSDA